jgi:hypothetical protein
MGRERVGGIVPDSVPNGVFVNVFSLTANPSSQSPSQPDRALLRNPVLSYEEFKTSHQEN